MYTESEEYAVRWPQRYHSGLFSVVWTKWHWTNDSSMTLCGYPIRIGACDNCPLFPETDDEVERVDCFFCKRKLSRLVDNISIIC